METTPLIFQQLYIKPTRLRADKSVSNRKTCLYRKLDSAIMVMKSAEDGRRYDAASVRDGAARQICLWSGSLTFT